MNTPRTATVQRSTRETEVRVDLTLDGTGVHDVETGIPFFDHMLTLFTVHGFLDLTVRARGDLEVDFHHTVEDVGLVLGDALNEALGDRRGIRRFGHAVVPMDESLSQVAVDLSKRPYLVFRVPDLGGCGAGFDLSLAKEFFRAFATRGGMNLHVNVSYGENEHHVIESIFKSVGRAIDQAAAADRRVSDVLSSKGKL